EGFVDIFGGGADERNLEVVDDCRTIGGNGRHKAAFDEINEDRTEPGFNDMRSEAPQDAAAALFCLHDCADNRPEVGCGQNCWQRVDERAYARVGRNRTSEILDTGLAGAGL